MFSVKSDANPKILFHHPNPKPKSSFKPNSYHC